MTWNFYRPEFTQLSSKRVCSTFISTKERIPALSRSSNKLLSLHWARSSKRLGKYIPISQEAQAQILKKMKRRIAAMLMSCQFERVPVIHQDIQKRPYLNGAEHHLNIFNNIMQSISRYECQ
jgi:hypothetical protein